MPSHADHTCSEPSPDRVEALQQSLLAWYSQHQADLPWRRSPTPYHVVVSEFMLQQTQRARVAPAYERFIARFPDLRSLAAATTAEVIRAWAGLGYNGRAVRLHRVARTLVEAGGEVPGTPEILRDLPGIGEYTARAIACFGHGAQEWVVDINVSRVLRRALLGEPYPKPQRALDAHLAARVLPQGAAVAWNSALMDLGAAICKARSPLCGACPLRDQCPARIALMELQPGPLSLVAEERARYASGEAGRPRTPFKSTDRYLRGRIVAVLRSLSAGECVVLPELAKRATGMALPAQDDRVGPLVERLTVEGLAKRLDGVDGVPCYCLPT